jgi:HEPN domain-containing protein
MSFGIKRSDLIRLAEARYQDAETLLAAERYSGAYYLAGYSIELGLKASISKQIFEATLPDKKFINNIYIHDLTKLVGYAGLVESLKAAQDASAAFRENWTLVAQWNEETRYQMIDRYTSLTFVEAIGHPAEGVLQWVRKHW